MDFQKNVKKRILELCNKLTLSPIPLRYVRIWNVARDEKTINSNSIAVGPENGGNLFLVAR